MEFEKAVEKVIDYCQREQSDAIKGLNESWSQSRELFKSFYGESLPETNDLLDYFLSHRIASNEKETLFFAEETEEILCTDKGMRDLLKIKLGINSGTTECFLQGKEIGTKGCLLYQREGVAQKLAKNLVAAIIVFHGLASRVALGKAKGLKARYPFPSKNLIQKALNILEFEVKEDLLVHTHFLRCFLKCLSEQEIPYILCPSENASQKIREIGWPP